MRNSGKCHQNRTCRYLPHHNCLAALCNGTSHSRNFRCGPQALSAAQTGVFLYIEPLVAVVVAALVLAEPVAWTSLLGGAVILFGVWLINRPGQ